MSLNIPDLEWQSWALALLSGFIIGLSKSGIKGVAMLAVTILALVFEAKSSTGILLPMLIGADVLAVIYYNRHASWPHLARLMPWMVLGVLIGVWVGAELPSDLFKQGMAVVVIGSVIFMVLWERRQREVPKSMFFSVFMGLLAGFATMVGNLAGAFSNIYFLASRLPKNEFIGTAAWMFFLINLFKLPFHIFSWHTINADSFSASLLLFPSVVLGFIIGLRLVKLIKDHRFRQMILVLTAIGAVLILLK